MVIGDDFSVAPHAEAGTEDVNLEMGSRAAVGELHHAFVVDQRLASSIDGDLNGMAGLLVKEFDNNVEQADAGDRKSTRLNSSHQIISYAVFCLKKKKKNIKQKNHSSI